MSGADEICKRPDLTRKIDAEIFLEYYYLKDKLVKFCRENDLPAGGSKAELTDRIAHFLKTGENLRPSAKGRKAAEIDTITEDSLIEPNIVCSQKHRAFFKEKIGRSFSFNVEFQKWLKTNAGKTYADAIQAYHDIVQRRKKGKSPIDRQFEYNTYIRDFFADNCEKSLNGAITCWNYKKSKPVHNRYERKDIEVLGGIDG